MNYTILPDSQLMILIAQGDAEAFSELYDRYQRLVFSLALNSVGERPLAEEITLDVFTRIWQKAATYRADRAQVQTWLGRIARNQAIDALRRRGARLEQHSVSWAEVSDDVTSPLDMPEVVADLRLQKEQVRAAIAQLSSEQQEVLALAYFKGYPHSQIAKRLNQPLGTVKSRIRSAMQKLRQILAAE